MTAMTATIAITTISSIDSRSSDRRRL